MLGTTLYRMVESGIFDPKKPISNYLPEFSDVRLSTGEPISRPVELMDVVSTSLELAACSNESNSNAFGESLIPLLRGEPSKYQRKFAVAEVRDATAMVTNEYKYIETDQGPVLFDRLKDPDELENVADTNAKVCDEMQSQLAAWKKKHGPFIEPTGKSRSKADQ